MNLIRGILIGLVSLLAVCVAGMFVFRKLVLSRIQAEQQAGVSMAWSLLLPEEAFTAYETLVTNPDDADALLIAETSTVESLDGEMLSISGFMVPLDNQRQVTQQFLLVPFQGACIHTPAPPPNQVISVYAERAARLYHNWQPVTATGMMSVAGDSTSLAEAGYVMTLDRLDAYRESAGDEGEFEQVEGAHRSPLLDAAQGL